jgi:hypothetical protein
VEHTPPISALPTLHSVHARYCDRGGPWLDRHVAAEAPEAQAAWVVHCNTR